MAVPRIGHSVVESQRRQPAAAAVARFAAPATLILAPLLPSVIWVLLDRTVWPWDQAYYASESLRLYLTLVEEPTRWGSAILTASLPKAPVIQWIGQLFLPLAPLLGSTERALLVSVLAAQALGLGIVYSSLRTEDVPEGPSAAGAAFVAASPLFVGLSHQFLVEPYQLLGVAWAVALAVYARRWPRRLVVVHIAGVLIFALLVKVSAMAYVIGPVLLAVWYTLSAAGTRVPATSVRRHTRVALLLALAGALLTTAWYGRYGDDALNFAAWSASSGLWGHDLPFPVKLGYWLQTIQANLVPLPLVAAGALTLIMALVRRRSMTRPLAALAIVSLLQAAFIVSIMAASVNDDPRFLLPLAPYFGIMLAVGLRVASSGLTTACAIVLICIQLGWSHAQAFGLLPTASPLQGGQFSGPQFHPPLDQTWEASLLRQLVADTCRPDSSSQPTVIAANLTWLNEYTTRYEALRKQGLRANCIYTMLPFPPTDLDVAWTAILRAHPSAIIAMDPARFPVSREPTEPTSGLYPFAIDRFNTLDGAIQARLEGDHRFYGARTFGDGAALVYRLR